MRPHSKHSKQARGNATSPKPPAELRSPLLLRSKARNKTSGCSTLKHRRIFPLVASTMQAAESGNPFMGRHQTHGTFEH
ncbi:hypothetical protein SLEP1_g25857 [Rubroshorea leprosula]|uniref:Uncharacterized protein n=1 Tax=Rubroshorea leprosula TaxID=152421 RepID=A0AAV5JXR4_9ROSI|nr:hypothetical protein SLEP1_g25857 [Rubroshorea leprosula]